MSLTKRGASVGRGPPRRGPIYKDPWKRAADASGAKRCKDCGAVLPVQSKRLPNAKHFCPARGEYSLGLGRGKASDLIATNTTLWDPRAGTSTVLDFLAKGELP